MRIVILGGGVIGTTLAYFAARRGGAVTLVERAEIACAASGKSGGFLALDWCDGTPLETLARRSFALHATLANERSPGWGFRRMETYAGTMSARRGTPVVRSRAPAWVGADVAIRGKLGTLGTTAQIVPAAFTAAMMRAAGDHGAALRTGQAQGLHRHGDRVVGVEVDGAVLEADAVVIAMGPWSLLAAQWLPLPPVFGLKGHSLVFGTGDRLPAEALFLDVQQEDGSMLSPEVFPRPDGTTYVCAISTEPPLPLDPRHVAPDEGAIERLRRLCASIAQALADAPVLASQACFRPVTPHGLPLIGAVPGASGAYVAAGHSVWGMLNAPGTAEALVDLIFDGHARVVDLTAFDPARHAPFDRGRIRTGLGRAAQRAAPRAGAPTED